MRSLLPGAAIAIGSAFGITEWLGRGDAALLVLTLLCASSVALAIAASSAPEREALDETRDAAGARQSSRLIDRVGDLLV